MKRIFGLIFLACQFTFGYGQKINLDSAEQKLKLITNDTLKLNFLNELSGQLNDKYDDKNAFKYSQQAKALADKLISQELNGIQKQILQKKLCCALVNIGRSLFEQGKSKEALNNFSLALNISNEIKNDSLKGIAYSCLGITTMMLNDYKEAVNYCNKAISLFQKTKDQKNSAKVFQKLGMIFSMNDSTKDLSFNYYKKALNVFIEINDKKSAATACEYLAGQYGMIGDSKEAIEYLNKALALYKDLKDSVYAAFVMDNLGHSHAEQKNFSKALTYYSGSLSILEKAADTSNTLRVIADILRVYRETNNSTKIKEYLNKQLNICVKQNDYTGITGINIEIGNILKKEGDSLQVKNKFIEAHEKYNQAIHTFLTSISTYQKIQLRPDNKSANLVFTTPDLNVMAALEDVEGMPTFSPNKATKQLLQNCYRGLADTYSAMKHFDNAYKYQVLYSNLKDTLLNEFDVNMRNKLQAKMKSSSQQLEIIQQKALTDSLNNVNKIKNIEVKQQTKMKNIFIIGFSILTLLIFVLAIVVRQRQKANKKLNKTLIDLKGTQEQLIHQEKMASLGELTAGIAHEIQNPLNFVNNFSSLSFDLITDAKAASNKEEREEILNDLMQNMEKVNHHGKRAENVVKSMLLYSRSDKVALQEINLLQIADEILNIAYQNFQAKHPDFNCEIKKEYKVSQLTIKAIPQDFSRMFLNLFSNAFYAMWEKTKNNISEYIPLLEVTAYSDSHKIFYKVHDNGIGISETVIDKIFNPFFTTKPSGEGTGLGLGIGYDIIKAHRGDLKVKSTEGEFAEFEITLVNSNNLVS